MLVTPIHIFSAISCVDTKANFILTEMIGKNSGKSGAPKANLIPYPSRSYARYHIAIITMLMFPQKQNVTFMFKLLLISGFRV